MQSTNLYDQESSDMYDNNKMNDEIDDLAYETPVGWSSICLDQTIHYYMDCNITMSQSKSIES